MKISVVLEALTGSFETDMARASKTAQKRMQQIEKDLKQSAKAIGQAFVIATTATAAFVARQTDQIAKFKDLGQQMGDTAEHVSMLADAAGKADTPIESIAAASVKLTAALSKMDDESKGAGNAVAALGLNFDEFKRLNPVAQLDAVAKAMAGFEDGAGKTAVAVALFGKAGAELLPFLDEFAAEQEHAARVTNEQAEAADHLNDTIADAKKVTSQYANALATGMIPVFDRTLTALLENADGVDRLSEANRAGATWAKIMASGFIILKGAVVEVGTAIAGIAAAETRLFEDVTLSDLSNPFMFLYHTAGKTDEALGILKESFHDLKNEATADLVALDKVWNETGPMADVPKTEKRRLNFDATPPVAAKHGSGGSGVTQLTADAKEAKEADEALRKEMERLGEEGQRLAEALRTPTEIYAQQIDLIDQLYNGQYIDAETRTRALAQAADELGKSLEETGPEFEEVATQAEDASERMSTAWDEAVRSMESDLSDFLFDPFEDGLKGMLKSFGETIRRMLADAAAARIMEALMGKDGTSGVLGQLATAAANYFGGSTTASGGGRASGGPVQAGMAYTVGEHGTERFVPANDGYIIPNHKLDAQVVVHNHFHVEAPNGRVAPETQQQLMAKAYIATSRAARRNG